MKERDLILQWFSWKKAREGSAFSQKKLACSAGFSPTYLSNIITGTRNPGTKTLERIAEALGITMAEFYAGPPQFSYQSAAAADESPEKGHEQQAVAEKQAVEEAIENGQVTDEKQGSDLNDSHRDTSVKREDQKAAYDGEPEKTGLALSDTSPDQLERLFDTVGSPFADLFSLPPGQFPIIEEEPAEKEDAETHVSEKTTAEKRRADTIPLLNSAPKGDFRKWFNNVDWQKYTPGLSTCTFTGGDVFAIQMHDNSMAPDIEKSDVLIIRPDDKFTSIDGGIGVIILNDRFITRKIYIHKGEYILIPSNPAYKIETAPIDGTQIFKISLWIPAAKGKF
jgi:SOS-response transcriptional repressor LexA